MSFNDLNNKFVLNKEKTNKDNEKTLMFLMRNTLK